MPKCLSYCFSLFLLFSLLLAPPSSAAEPPKPIGPRIKIEPPSIDFGTIDTNESVTKTVRVTNTGDQTLETEEVCCGMVINQWRRKIAPGESVDFPILLDPNRLSPGPYQGSRTIRSNDAGQLHSRIEVLAFNRPLVYIQPPVIQFGTVPAGKEGTAIMTIASRDKDVEVRSIETGHSLITVRPLDANMVVAHNPNFPGHQQWEFTLSKNAPTGSLPSTAKLVLLARHPDHPNDPPQKIELTASIIAHVQGRVAAEPRFIRVAQTFHGEPFTERILVSSVSGPFKITSCKIVESTLPGVSARTEPLEDGELKRHYLILEGKGGDTPGMFRGYVEVSTDIPNESPLRIQFNGFVRAKPATSPIVP